ncbi:ArsR family transcriptional regulator [Ornithinimicrobium ciconiae]|uniref:ArsR family transcriptional regulator n=1 Tax=Ornithinimicrobium ciconiae TaxID=2594265 RepID=A0A516G9D9_9MICO|nr:ArsR family transcriptional regulator [Ornithinimicrobium ciconiae]QDO88144.1 ArsR family transcriptional regulator [Ornithinimicrobium ciconiae]
MTRETPPGTGSPGPSEVLRRRAAQLQALTEPVRLLALSFLAQEPDHALSKSDLAAQLHLTPSDLEVQLEVLVDSGLVALLDEVVTLTVDSWQHFRAIIAPKSTGPGGLPQGFPMARETDWSGYPAVVRRIADQLAQRFRTTFSRNTVHRYVAESYDELSSRSKVSRHIPMLTNRLATERLAGVAAARGIVLHPVPSILFVCVHNAGRSQMAMAWAEHLAGDLITVQSAGSTPAVVVHPTVLTYLGEAGLELPRHGPRVLTEDLVRTADIIVTMGCGDACPVIPGRRYFDWDVPDPGGQPLEAVREIAEEIRGRVDHLLAELGIGEVTTRPRGIPDP